MCRIWKIVPAVQQHLPLTDSRSNAAEGAAGAAAVGMEAQERQAIPDLTDFWRNRQEIPKITKSLTSNVYCEYY
jgi:hypothetical protein